MLLQLAKERIREKAQEMGFDWASFAPPSLGVEKEHVNEWISRNFHGTMQWMEKSAAVRTDPQKYLPHVQSIIVLGAGYAKPLSGALASTSPSPLIASYARSRDYHRVLRKPLKTFAMWIAQEYRCAVSTSLDAQPVLEKAFAAKTGIGFMGKNTNVIHPKFGSYFFLACLLTTLPLPPDTPSKEASCKTCTRCLEACPTEALIAPYLLDASRCIAYLTIEHKGEIEESLRQKMGTWVFGCDICQIVCPFNHAPPEPIQPELQESPLFSTLTWEQLAGLSKDEFRELFSGTPLLRAGRDAFLRNLAVAMGNTGDLRYLRLLSTLQKDSSPLVAAHAKQAKEHLLSSCTVNPAKHAPTGETLAGELRTEKGNHTKDEALSSSHFSSTSP